MWRMPARPKPTGVNVPVVSVINYKGGVGKTTLTANLGAELAWRGRRVLLMDLDAQSSLTFSLVKPDDWRTRLATDKTILKWYESFRQGDPVPLKDLVLTPSSVGTRLALAKSGGQLDLIPSHLGLINVDLELATELGGASMKQAKHNYIRVHRRLADGLDDPHFSQYDVVLIDCPPNFNVVTKTAIVASDHVLIPAKADYLSTLGIDYLLRSLNELVSDYNEFASLESPGETASPPIGPQILGVVFTMLQIYGGRPISALRPYIAQTKRLGVTVFDSHMRENKTLFSDAPAYGVPVVLDGNSGAQHIVDELEALVTEFENRAGL
ncbi:ParA family protein [Cellulomonas sp. CW35]|uniref:ParA family protein n=1 Tax=Cellulomonas sp. CW35 TaxID=3458249 RepID=UPI004033CF9E